MNLASLITLSVGIAMDAFAVSITSGVVLKKQFNMKNVIKIGLFFSLFQAIMPLIGWLFGSSFYFYIKSLDHWIVFLLLLTIGLKMVYDSITEEREIIVKPLDNKILTYLALATSIDALAVGFSFAFLKISIMFSIICIGLTTFVLSITGVLIGKYSGERLKKKAGIFGGIGLIFIGVKILLEHLNIF